MVGLLSIALGAGCSTADDPTDRAGLPDRGAAGTDEGLPRPAPPPGAQTAPTADAVDGGTSATGSAGQQRIGSRYVTGLTLTALTNALAAHGVSCAGGDGTVDQVEWSCSGIDATRAIEYSVVIEGADENRIRHVTALVTQYGPPVLEVAVGFLGDIASVDYRGADPARARDWVRSWLNGAAQSDEQVIGDAALALQGTVESCSLDLVAPEIMDG